MTKRLKILLPAMAALVAMSGYYFSLRAEAYGFRTESDSCQQFSEVVAELGLKKAIGLEAFRNVEEDGFFLVKMAKWFGIKQAARDCVDMEG